MPTTAGPTIPERLAAGDVLAAVWIALDSAVGTELLASRGFDVAVLDMQHGLIDPHNLPRLLQGVQTAGTSALVRVPSRDAAGITRALDLGADGVIVPLVNDAAEAEAAVAAGRYPPKGARSYGPLRAALRFGDAAAAERSAAIFVMVETQRALDDVDAIAATPGLTGIFVGPADLGLAMGLGPQTDSRRPEHLDALERVVSACRRHEVACGIYCADPRYARERADDGMQLVVVASDATMLAEAAAARLHAWRTS